MKKKTAGISYPPKWFIDARTKVEKIVTGEPLPVIRIEVKPNELNENRMCCGIIENGLIFEMVFND